MKKWTLTLIAIVFAGLVFWSCSGDDNGSTDPVNQSPTFTITSPQPYTGFNSGEVIEVKVSAEDSDGEIKEVRFFLNGEGEDSESSFPYNGEISTTDLITGGHIIKVEVEDDEGAISETELPFGIKPQAPTNLQIVQNNVYTFTLNWEYGFVGSDGFKIERKIDDGDYEEIKTTTALTFVDSTLSKKGYESVYYQVRAYKDVYGSDYTSNSYSISFPAPYNLTYSKINLNTIQLNWLEASDGEDGFIIDKKVGVADWITAYANVGENIRTWSDASAEINQDIQYRIYAYKGNNTSGSTQTSTIANTFPVPSNLTLTPVNLTTATIAWTDNSKGEEKFEIERKLSTETIYINIGEVTGSDTSTKTWNDTTVEPAKIYDYRVRAIKSTDTSDYVTKTGFNNTFTAPSNLSVIQNNVYTFTLNWTDNSTGEDGFKIERKIDDGTYTEIATITGTSYTDDTVSKGFGVVYYRVRAYKDTYYSNYASQSSVVTFPAPTNLTYTKVNLNTVKLDWLETSNGEDGFKIDKKIGAADWTIAYGNVGSNIKTWTDSSSDINQLLQYRVYAYKGTNTTATIATSSIDNTFPAPTDLSISQNNITSATVSWTDNSTGEDKFEIERKLSTETTFVKIADVTGSDTSTKTWNDTSLIPNLIYDYRVKAVKGVDSSEYNIKAYSNIFPVPTNLNVSSVDLTSTTLSWTDNSIGEDKFEIERKLSTETTFVKIADVTGSDTSTKTWNDTSLIPNLIYDYRVKAVKDTYSTSYTEKTYENIFPAPANLTVAQNNVSTFTLNWADNSTGEDGFRVERRIDDDVYTEINTTTGTSYVDNTVSKKGYSVVYYRVSGYKGSYNSDYASNSSAVTFPAPTNLTFSKVNLISIKLDWSESSNGEDGFKIDKKVGTAEWVIAYGTVGSNIKTWTDTSAEINKSILYRVYGYKGSNTTSSVTTPTIDNTFPVVSNFTATQTSITSATIAWSDNSIGEDKYELERKLTADPETSFAKIADITGSDTTTKSYNDTNLEPDATYDYRVRGVRGTIYSTYVSKIGYVNTFQTPSNLNVVQDNVYSFTLNWTDNSIGEDGFKIERKIDDGSFTEIATVTGTSYTDDTVTKKGYGTVYYQVRAYKGTFYTAYTSNSSFVSFPAPTNLTFAKENISTIRLNWTDNSDGEDGFIIDKKVGTAEWVDGFATIGSNLTTWTDSSAEINQSLTYRISAYKGLNSTATLATSAIDNTFPIPSNFSVTQTSITSATIEWTDNSLGEEKFEIERKLSIDTDYVKITEITGSDTATKSWLDTTVMPSMTYDFRIRAINGTDSSSYVLKSGYNNPFQPPTGLTIVQDNVYTFSLNWTDNSIGEDGFKIERKIDDESFTEIATVTGTSYTDATVAKKGYGTVYYQVRGYKGTDYSAYTSNNSAVSFPAPTNLTIIHTSLTSATLSWSDNSLGEDKFEIERKLSSESTFTKIGEVIGSDVSSKSWSDISLEVSGVYDYRIKAVKGINNSDYLEDYGYIAFPPPTSLTAVIVDGSSIKLDWIDNSIGEDGFIIDRKVGSNGTWIADYAIVNTDTETWIDSTIITGLTYFYRVRANYTTYFSNYSSEATGFISNIRFILFPEGNFSMGQDGVATPVHTVNITKSFFIGRYEVTQKEWLEYMSASTYDYGAGDDFPVYQLSWYSTLVYCNFRSIAEGLTPCYTINNSTNPNDWGAIPTNNDAIWDAVICDFNENGYRLPTEAEWEYATRYNDGRSYPWGNAEPTSSMCNWDNSASSITGSYNFWNSNLGLCDAAGNVWEWVWDWKTDYTSEEQTDPIGPLSGTTRVVKGGSWASTIVSQLKSAYRISSNPYYESKNCGFRIARTK